MNGSGRNICYPWNGSSCQHYRLVPDEYVDAVVSRCTLKKPKVSDLLPIACVPYVIRKVHYAFFGKSRKRQRYATDSSMACLLGCGTGSFKPQSPIAKKRCFTF